MPRYEYSCGEHTTTRWAGVGDHPERIVCPTCGRPAERVIAPPMLKHDGAYSHKPDAAA